MVRWGKEEAEEDYSVTVCTLPSRVAAARQLLSWLQARPATPSPSATGRFPSSGAAKTPTGATFPRPQDLGKMYTEVPLAGLTATAEESGDVHAMADPAAPLSARGRVI